MERVTGEKPEAFAGAESAALDEAATRALDLCSEMASFD
jgi:hypothetical protein